MTKRSAGTQRPNSLVKEAVLNGVIEELKGYENVETRGSIRRRKFSYRLVALDGQLDPLC